MIKCARHYDSKCWPMTTITARLNEFPASFLYNKLAIKNCEKTFLKNFLRHFKKAKKYTMFRHYWASLSSEKKYNECSINTRKTILH